MERTGATDHLGHAHRQVQSDFVKKQDDPDLRYAMEFNPMTGAQTYGYWNRKVTEVAGRSIEALSTIEAMNKTLIVACRFRR